MHVGSKGKRLRTDVFFPPLIYPTQIVRKTKSRQADSNRLPLLITSDQLSLAALRCRFLCTIVHAAFRE